MLRRIILTGLSTCLLALTFAVSQPAQAEAASASGDCPSWVNVKTGGKAKGPLVPNGLRLIEGESHPTASVIGGTDTYVQDAGGSWINVKTGGHASGSPVPNGLVLIEGETPPTARVVDGTDIYVLVPCPPSTAFQVGGVGFRSALLVADYAHISPSAGPNENSYGFSLGAITNPFSGDTGGTNPLKLDDNLDVADPIPAQGGGIIAPSLEVMAGYHRTDFAGTATTTWTAGGSLIWTVPAWRFGPAAGFQSNSTGGFDTQTWNYGGYAEWFVSPAVNLFAKGGGFSSNGGASDGFYFGGSGKYYATPDFALNAGFDYTRFTSFGGSNEEDYTVGGEYLFSETTPIALFGGYTYSQFSGSFHTNRVFVGLRFYVNGQGVSTLVNRQRTGEPPPHQFKF